MLIQMTGTVTSITAKTHWSSRQLEGYDIRVAVEFPDPNDESKVDRRDVTFPLPVTIAPPLAGSLITVQIFQVDKDIEVPDEEKDDSPGCPATPDCHRLPRRGPRCPCRPGRSGR